MRWMRRRRERQAAELARLFAALDAAACERRGGRPRPRARVSVGGIR